VIINPYIKYDGKKKNIYKMEKINTFLMEQKNIVQQDLIKNLLSI
jgi:hypothetical protein